MKYIRKIITFGLVPLLATLSATQVSGEQEIKWETYHDYEHGWSINYPSDWGIERRGEREGIFLIGKGGVSAAISREELAFPISLEEHIPFIEGEVEKMVEQEGLFFSKLDEQRVEVGNNPAIEVVYLAGESPDNPLIKGRLIVIVKDKAIYGAICFAPTISYDQANEVYFEPMIQSFKFEEHKEGQ
jgi:hypothetical protein